MSPTRDPAAPPPFASDVALPDMLHAATLRSGIARGRIQSITRDEGFDWGAVVVLGPDDLEGLPRTGGRPVLAAREVRHREEAILVVAAADLETARAAVRAFEVRYAPRAPVESISEALTGRVRVGDGDNVHADHLLDEGGEAALAAAARVVERTWSFPLHDPLELEPRAVVAEPRPDGVRVHAAVEDPAGLRAELAAALAAPAEAVEVVACRRGGVRRDASGDPTVLALRAALLARKAGRPVRIALSRREETTSAPKRPCAEIRIRCGLDAEGAPAGLQIDAGFDGGAWPSAFFVEPGRALRELLAPWDLGPLTARARVVATNTPCNGGTADACALPLTFALQRHLDLAAGALGVDALAFRRGLLRDEAARVFLDRAVAAAGAGGETIGGAALASRFVDADGEPVLAAAFLRVAVDPATLVARALSACVVFDALPPGDGGETAAAAAGGVADGIGLAASEELLAEMGGVANAGLAEYAAPTAADLPRVRTFFVGEGPRRIDGRLAASLARCATAPAFAAAASQALASDCDELPLTPVALAQKQGPRTRTATR